jgi:hypothetical protein
MQAIHIPCFSCCGQVLDADARIFLFEQVGTSADTGYSSIPVCRSMHHTIYNDAPAPAPCNIVTASALWPSHDHATPRPSHQHCCCLRYYDTGEHQ